MKLPYKEFTLSVYEEDGQQFVKLNVPVPGSRPTAELALRAIIHELTTEAIDTALTTLVRTMSAADPGKVIKRQVVYPDPDAVE